MGKSQAEVFEHSYDEVLAALKHQDDKLNRTLTALAFLTGAGVALILNLKNLTPPGQEQLRLGEGPVVTGFLFVVFICAVVAALALALAAIGPSSPLSFPRHGGPADTDDSLLFWGKIARDAKWDEKRTLEGTALEDRLRDDLHDEARDISLRVKYKVARSRESAAFVYLAIVCLALIGIFGSASLSADARWWIASAVLGIALLLPFIDSLHMELTDFPETGSWPAYAVLAIAVAPAIALLVLGQTAGHYWPALYTALGVFLVSRLALIKPAAAVVLVPAAALGSIVVLIVTAF